MGSSPQHHVLCFRGSDGHPGIGHLGHGQAGASAQDAASGGDGLHSGNQSAGADAQDAPSLTFLQPPPVSALENVASVV